jgi:hypothetical protein
MNEHQVKHNEEWGGQKSTKFWPSKMHIEQKVTTDPQYKQIFDSAGKKHIPAGRGSQPEWKPSVRQIDYNDIHELKKQSCKGATNTGIHQYLIYSNNRR